MIRALIAFTLIAVPVATAHSEDEIKAKITVTLPTDRKVEIKFTAKELDKAKDSDFLRRKFADANVDLSNCQEPKPISDECWKCKDGKVICTGDSTLQAALKACFKSNKDDECWQLR